jgi:WD40 repeat protein
VKIRKVIDGTEARSITVMTVQKAGGTGLSDLAFSPDGKYLVTTGSGTPIKLWEVRTGLEVRSFFGQVGIRTVAFSPDGTRLASAGRDGEVKIWDAAGEPGLHRFFDEMENTGRPTFSPDGRFLAELLYGAKVGQVQVRDAETGHLVARLDHGRAKVSAFAFSSDSTQIVTAIDHLGPDMRQVVSRKVQLWDLSSREVIGAITGFNERVSRLAFSPDNQLLATLMLRSDPDTRQRTGEIKLWDVKTRKEVRSYPGTWMAFSPSGAMLAVVGQDESVTLFHLSTNQALRVLPSRAGRSHVAFNPDGTWLCDDREVWDVADRRQVCLLTGNNAPAEFSPDGMRLFSLKGTSLSNGLLQVWDPTTGDLLASIPVQANQAQGVSLHPDGWRCACSSPLGTWILDGQPLTPELRRKRDAHNLVAHLIWKPMLKDELIDQLTSMNHISESLRREALALARTVEIPSWVYVYAAWDIVLYPDRPEEQYRRALRWIEEANRVSPNDGEVLNELGMALYRLGQFKEAAEQLERAFKINRSGFLSPARDLVFLAMAEHRLGREKEARKTLAEARKPSMGPGQVSPHVWDEAKALIEGKPNEPNK